MTRVAASVARAKREHPEQFCPHPRCLWRTGGALCPRHRSFGLVPLSDRDEEDAEYSEAQRRERDERL